MGSEPNGRTRFLHGLGENPDWREFHKLALIARFFFAPKNAQCLNGLVEMLPTLVKLHAKELRLFSEPAGSYPKDQPAA